MATGEKLKGSFGSLIDTLTSRFDPLRPADLVTSWASLLVRCSSCARETEAWNGIPPEDPAFDPVIKALDDATHAIVTARTNAETEAALGAGSHALDPLERLLGI